MKPIIIGISGKMGSGKSTLAATLRNHFLLHTNRHVEEVKFAGPLYGAVSALQSHLGIAEEKDRELMQYIGSHYRAKEGPSFWANQLKDRLTILQDSYPGVVILIDDLRYPEELKALKEVGALTVRLNCEEQDRARRVGAGLFLNPGHASEVGLDSHFREFDLVLDSFSIPPSALAKIVLDNIRINELVSKYG